MKEQNKVTGLSVRSLRTIVVLAICVFALALSAMAQTPAAGTKIGNQASATYTDASNVGRTATSNAVYTTVQQVPALTLTPSTSAKTGAIGTQVTYAHTLTNTGNGTDTFTLTVAAGTGFAHTGMTIYADANGDGIPDNNVPVTSVTIAPGAANAFNFVVVGSIPGTASGNGQMVVTATSTFGSHPTASATDTTTVTGNAVISATKSISQTSGKPGDGPFTVTFTYTNNGNATATAVKFVDILNAGFVYQTGSGLWSGTGATALTDATGDNQPAAGSPHIDYSITGSTVTAIVDSVAPGASGTISFTVKILATQAPGQITNVAAVSYNDGAAAVGPFNTNTVTFNVLQTGGVSITATDLTNTATVASVVQGGTASFTNVVKNTGTGTDTMNVTVANGTFPAGTTFALFKSDGVTPLIDTNGDGIPDVGPLAAGASYNVIVKATLPAGASGNNGGAGFTATATATSTFDGTKTSSMTDKLTTITANSVDISNVAPNGVGAGPEASSQTTLSTNPGTSVTFVLNVKNTSAGLVSDSYDLTAYNTSAGAALPAGWSVVFRASLGADCSAANLGGIVTNTGVLNAAATKLFCGVVSVPAGYAPGTVNVFFQAKSPTSLALDQVFDAVTVNTLHAVVLTPNNSGQIFPNGSVVYKHILTNNGNVNEAVTLTAVDSLGTGWASVLYQDAGGAGAGSLDPSDPVVSSIPSLAPGASVILFVKVSAPAGASIGAIDTTTATATYSSTTSTATDSSTVIAGDLRLVKTQALDAGCLGTPGAFSQADVSALPGQCVVYQITATNQGTAPVTTIVISDSTPAYTMYWEGGAVPPASSSIAGGTITKPASGNAGTVSVNLGAASLAPGASEVFTFTVKINP